MCLNKKKIANTLEELWLFWKFDSVIMCLTQSIPFPIDTTLNKALYSNAKCYIKSINIKPTGEGGG